MAVEDEIAFRLALQLQHYRKQRDQLLKVLAEIADAKTAHPSRLRQLARSAVAKHSDPWVRRQRK